MQSAFYKPSPVSGKDFFYTFLNAHQVSVLFGVPGAQLDPLYSPVPAGQQLVLARHETTAGYMAEGAARLSGRPGVVFGIGGPGCAQLLPAVMSAAAEQTPLLVVTGDHLSHCADQGGFQAGGAADRALLAPYCKAQLRIEQPADWLQLPQLWAQCQAVPAGPVQLQVPFDSWFFAVPEARELAPELAAPVSIPLDLTPWLQAPRVAVLAGGLFPPAAAPALRRWLEQHQLPLATSLDARGLLPEDHPLCAGVFGYGGTQRASDLMLQDLDTLLVLGAPLNERNTLNQHPGFWRKKQIVTLGCPLPSGLAGRVQQALPRPDLPALLASLNAEGASVPTERETWLRQWQARTAADTGAATAAPEVCSKAGSAPLLQWIRALQASWPADCPLFVDAGQVRPAIAAGWRVQQPGQIQMANQLGAMGWALGAGIGACALSRQATGILIGDGSLLMYGLDLSVAVQHQLPLCCLLSDNGSWGSVQQRLPGDSSLARFAPVDWPRLAEALGLQVFCPQSPAELVQALQGFFAQPRPSLIVLPTPADYSAPAGQTLNAWLSEAHPDLVASS